MIGLHLLSKERGVQGWELGRCLRRWQIQAQCVVGNSSIALRGQRSGDVVVSVSAEDIVLQRE